MNKDQVERRFVAHGLLVERRAADQMPTLRGYAAVFNEPSVELWGFYEIILPGAFTESIAAGDEVKALWNHDANWVMAASGNGTLRMREDARGLAVEFEPVDTPIMRGFVASIERGDVNKMSFAMKVVEDKWGIDGTNRDVRKVVKAKLYDVAPVAYPAYPQTEIGLRSQAGAVDPEWGYIPAPPQQDESDGQAAGEIAAAAAAQERTNDLRQRVLQARLAQHMRGNRP